MFAAGCFSELADDFASVVLEMLVNIVTYPETVSTVRLAAVRVFAKMGFSFSIANRAYKVSSFSLNPFNLQVTNKCADLQRMLF